MNTRPSLRERFERFFQRAGDDCWVWVGHRSVYGYGKFHVRYQSLPAHRISYELYVGVIPDGKVIDHLCRNRACVNPDHLRAVTQRENILRGVGVAARRSKMTECHAGHPLTGDNVRIEGVRSRRCKKCAYETNVRTRLRRKELGLKKGQLMPEKMQAQARQVAGILA